MKTRKHKVWLDNPEEHDYPAARDYLELCFEPNKAKEIAALFGSTITTSKKAKDIFRAAGLKLLPITNKHVASNIRKFKKGKRLSPLLLYVADKLIIADGFHRLCASYYLSEDLDIRVRIVHS